MKNKYRILPVSMLIILLIIVTNSIACYIDGLWYFLFYHLGYGVILSLLVPIWYVRKNEHLTYDAFGIKKVKLIGYIVILAFIAFSIGGQLINLKFKDIHFEMLPLSIAPLLMTTFFEEFLFRGFMQTRFEKAFGLIPAIILSGLAFSLYHLGYPGFRSLNEIVLLLFVGIMFALAYKLSGNNLIVSYFVNLPNAFLTYLVNYKMFPDFTPAATVISVIAIFVIIYVLITKFKKVNIRR